MLTSHMKKTKKEKIIADLRKKEMILENRFAYKAETVAPQNFNSYKIPEKIISKSTTLTIDYKQISSELRKTLLISLFVVSLLLALKFVLKL
jgi:hypothetical protein